MNLFISELLWFRCRRKISDIRCRRKTSDIWRKQWQL